jgi:hypothetical protein
LAGSVQAQGGDAQSAMVAEGEKIQRIKPEKTWILLRFGQRIDESARRERASYMGTMEDPMKIKFTLTVALLLGIGVGVSPVSAHATVRRVALHSRGANSIHDRSPQPHGHDTQAHH